MFLGGLTPFGSLAIHKGPMALRPTLAGGLPLSRNPAANLTSPGLHPELCGARKDGAATRNGRDLRSHSLPKFGTGSERCQTSARRIRIFLPDAAGRSVRAQAHGVGQPADAGDVD